MTPLVRPARAGDGTAIAELIGELGYPVDAGHVERRLAGLPDGHLVLVATDGDRVTGWLHAVHWLSVVHGERVQIAGLAVAADQHGLGVGSALVERAEGWATERGVATMGVFSGSERSAAHRFYRGRGYREVKTEQAFTKSLPAH